MTPDERNVLGRFLSDLEASRGATKDAEADGMISNTLRSNPEAAYLLVQHAILADQALQAAQQRIDALQSQSPSNPSASSFLGAPSQTLPAPAQQPYWESSSPPPPQSPLAPSSGLGGFLRSAGTMAAGVAGGEFLAQGLSNLFAPRDW